MNNKENKSKRVVNALKKSAVGEHLVVNLDCANNYNLKNLNWKLKKKFFSFLDLN